MLAAVRPAGNVEGGRAPFRADRSRERYGHGRHAGQRRDPLDNLPSQRDLLFV